ncbi:MULTISPECIES: acyclic terpene utilization AtuA family protein [unclassified Clostridium]|uniref:acyclic terpene utilization AtuA family protein n=1 Tax=unclassified Clostridium TaxID=2614128 RepID=UPI001106FD24|nr:MULTISPECIES: acyclic terpene utilization AtuA family protein [unclassified Clostridium]
MKTIRIGSGAGYGGDRIEPAIDLMNHGALDYIIFECLAERTIALAQLEKLSAPDKGYNPLFEMRMERILEALKTRRTKVITNMGAANPLAAAEKAVEMARAQGLAHLKIAAVTGDDLLPQLERHLDEPVIETGRPLRELQADIVSANAYLGCAGIVEALQGGADIVITGRVADPALVLGPLVYEFGWSMQDYDRLGKGTIAGHLLECAGQVTGGYFCDPGVKDVPELWNLGFPIAQVDEEGHLVITKLPQSGGLVSEQTVKEQIIYELQDPAQYFTPDCMADFQYVSVAQQGKDRVAVSGATGQAPNGKYKVSVGYQDCFIGEGQISYGGSTALARAKLAGEVVQKRLEAIGCRYDELRIDLMGVDSLYREQIATPLMAGMPCEVRLRVAARCRSQQDAALVGNEVEALYTNGPAGGGGAVKSLRKIVSVASILVPRDDAPHFVHYWEV